MSLKSLLKKWILRISAILLPVSVGFVAVSVTLLLLGGRRLYLLFVPSFVIPVVCFGSAAILWFAAFQLRSRTRFSFSATLLTLTGGFLLLVDMRSITLSLKILWPVMAIIVGVSFFVSGLFRYRRFHAVFVVLSSAFCAIGLVFLLFSTRLVRIAFIPEFLWWTFPVLLPAVAYAVWFFRNHAGAER